MQYGPGDYFGEIAMIHAGARKATVRSLLDRSPSYLHVLSPILVSVPEKPPDPGTY